MPHARRFDGPGETGDVPIHHALMVGRESSDGDVIGSEPGDDSESKDKSEQQNATDG
ncbi:hypothetical protein LBMAG56_24340 [Verrucomicrobiota bacterium]|nr:hypothetical protein LBMAG56_24340 [Verrucomicrobiota bacterium]